MAHPIESAGPRRTKVVMSAADRARYQRLTNPVPYREGFGTRNDPWSATSAKANDPWYSDFGARGIWPPDPTRSRE